MFFGIQIYYSANCLMRVLFLSFFGLFLICFCFDSLAQISQSTISGTIYNENRQVAEAATVVLLKAKDSTIVKSVITNKKGQFQIKGVQAGNFILLVKAVGYLQVHTDKFQVAAAEQFNIPEIVLKSDVQQLKEVAVVSSRPAIEVKPGKTILNIQNSLSAEGNSAFDILTQAPGVKVVKSNNFSVVGREVALITIDGKPTNLSGEDLATLLKSIQKNSIDRIELVTSTSAKDDAAAAGIINIVLVKSKSVGFNGSITATAGYGTYYKSNAGMVFNYRTEKFNVFGNYSFSDNKTFHDFTKDRMFVFNDVNNDYKTDYNSKQKTISNNFRVGADYYINQNQTIGFLVYGLITDQDFTKDNNLSVFENTGLDSSIAATSQINRHITRVTYNLNYLNKLDKKGTTIAADFNYYDYNRSSTESITNSFYNQKGINYKPDSLLKNVSPSIIHNWLAKIDFTDPISSTLKLEAGIKYSKTTSDNNLFFSSLYNGTYNSVLNFSNHFIYNEDINAAYINVTQNYKKMQIVTGLRAEQTISDGNSITLNQSVKNNYIDLFPQFLLTYHLNEKNDLTLSYNRGISRPGYATLNPFYYFVDLYDYTVGYPYLKPSYSNSIELTFSHSKTYSIDFYASILGNAYNFNYYVQNDTSKISLDTYRNLGTVYNYGLRVFVPVTFTSWWTANFNLDAGYQGFTSYALYGNIKTGGNDTRIDISQNFTLSKTVSAEVSGFYETPFSYSVSQFKSSYEVRAAISKQLFHKKGSLKLNADDVFNNFRRLVTVNYQNVNLKVNDKVETQIVRLTFSYRFGKTTVKAAKTHQTGNEDEQRRTGGNN